MARKNLKSMNMKNNNMVGPGVKGLPGNMPGIGGNLTQLGRGLNNGGGLGLSAGGGLGLNLRGGGLANNSGLLSANLGDQSVKLDPKL